jgi:hypothetical protein
MGVFVAFKADGSITAWGDPDSGGTIPTSIGRITPAKVVSYTMVAIKLHPSFDIILATK